MRIYTKTGDRGDTGLSGGMRTRKSSKRIECIGDVDELNAQMGICRCLAENTDFSSRIASIQGCLFDLGAELSVPATSNKSFEFLTEADILALEESIDQQEELLDPLRHFVLPGGSKLASQFHVARTVCRRAERHLVELHDEEPQRAIVLAYLNRLSDWLFVAARTANRTSNVKDLEWIRG